MVQRKAFKRFFALALAACVVAGGVGSVSGFGTVTAEAASRTTAAARSATLQNSQVSAASDTVTSLDEPTMASAEVISNGVTITWGAVDGAEKYGVYRKLEGDSTWTRVGSTTETTYTSQGVTSGKYGNFGEGFWSGIGRTSYRR